jgi:hypothetical protein
MLVLPTMTAPAWRSRATIGASYRAGGASRSAIRRGGRRLAGDVEEILDRDRDTGERAGRDTGLAQPVLRGGGGTRLLGIDLEEGTFALARRIGDPGQRLVGELAAAGASFAQRSGELRQGGMAIEMRLAHQLVLSRYARIQLSAKAPREVICSSMISSSAALPRC